MKIIQRLYNEFNSYFSNLSVQTVNNEYLLADCIYIDKYMIVSTYEFEIVDIIAYDDCKSMFINNIIHNYLLDKNELNKNELKFIDKYYQYCAFDIFKRFCQKFPNNKYKSYLLLLKL